MARCHNVIDGPSTHGGFSGTKAGNPFRSDLSDDRHHAARSDYPLPLSSEWPRPFDNRRHEEGLSA
jgi:hypothetical protein